jgi:hypothetical protein
MIFLLEIKHMFALVFKMSWYEIQKKVQGTRNKKIDESKKRLFRVAILSCACLLMNTAATVSLSVVLEDWSVSSDQWLTCTVLETFVTRNWANYGLHIGDRYFLFWFLTERYLLVTVLIDCCCFDFCTSPPGYETGDEESEEAAERRRGLLKQVCPQERVAGYNLKWSDSTSLSKIKNEIRILNAPVHFA